MKINRISILYLVKCLLFLFYVKLSDFIPTTKSYIDNIIKNNNKSVLKLKKLVSLPALIILLFSFTRLYASSPNDSLVFKNGNMMDGEIKTMNQGVIVVSTDYSDSDFKIDWSEIQGINTKTLFFITLSAEAKYYGTLKSISESRVNILTVDKKVVECDLNDNVYLAPLKKDFLDRLYASIDIGLSLTKANNLRQLTSRSTIGYRAEKWLIDATFNAFYSIQDSVESIERGEGKINYIYVLPRVWYATTTISLASNTEQKLDLRINARLGLGRFIIRTNSAYWGVNLGLNRNVEQYTSETADRNSWEGYLGTELNLYDIGDLDLLTIIMAYPGITAKERFRADITLDTKYDLPYDFYIKIGLTINYDNRPAEGASETDYVLQNGFGWGC